MGIVPPCSTSFLSGCATVAKSQYSVFFGVPLSLLGMIFYLGAILVCGIILFRPKEIFKKILLALSFAGVISSIYFIYLQAFVIKAFCVYCVLSALSSFILAFLSVYIYRARNNTLI
jgi:uncharacterized membrane protein